MKKLTALAVLLTVIGTASFASSGPLGENSNFKLIAKADSKYELFYVSTEQGNVRVTIYDDQGKNIESKFVKDVSKFRRTFDFSQLEAGNYSVVVTNEDGTAREKIAYKVEAVKLQTIVSRIPDSKSLKLHVGDFESTKPVNVKIYNEKNRVVYKDKITNAKAFSKVYNLNKTKAGDYTVQIENNGVIKSFTHTIK